MIKHRKSEISRKTKRLILVFKYYTCMLVLTAMILENLATYAILHVAKQSHAALSRAKLSHIFHRHMNKNTIVITLSAIEWPGTS